MGLRSFSLFCKIAAAASIPIPIPFSLKSESSIFERHSTKRSSALDFQPGATITSTSCAACATAASAIFATSSFETPSGFALLLSRAYVSNLGTTLFNASCIAKVTMAYALDSGGGGLKLSIAKLIALSHFKTISLL